MEIVNFLTTERFITRKELIELTGLNDRVIRNKISELKETVPVIYNSQTSGYRLAKDLSKLSPTELQEELELIEHCINDIEARKSVFNYQERTYIAYLEKGKDILKKKQQLIEYETYLI